VSYFKAKLLSDNSKDNELTKTILKIINEKNPQSVRQLTTTLKESLNLKEEKILEFVLKLQAEGTIKLENQPLQPQSFSTYMRTSRALWYWVTIVTGAITAITVFAISEDFYPWIYMRNLLGILFVLFLPGYAFTKAIFPVDISTGTSNRNLETPERLALSLGLSIALVSIVGFLLYYSTLGIELAAVVSSLLAFTSVLATVAVIREYQVRKSTLVNTHARMEVQREHDISY
jgi:hypothetical protein